MICELPSVYEDFDIKGYTSAELLSEMDYTLITLVEHYESLDSVLKQIFREGVSQEFARLLQAFAERIASYLINENDQKLFQMGLHALDACMEKTGTRDVFALLSLYHNVYKRHMFVFADFLSSEEPIGKALQMFLLRDDKARTIGAMDYIIAHNTVGQAFFKQEQVRF